MQSPDLPVFRKPRLRVHVLARFRIAAGRAKAVRLRFEQSKLRLIRAHRGLRRLTARARVSDGAGNRSTVGKKLFAVPAKKRASRR
jgi:hypothetical protein